MKNKTVFEYQWLQPVTNQGTNTTYEPTIEFLTENQAKKQGLKICLHDTKRTKISTKTLNGALENLVSLCSVNLKRFKAEQYTYSPKEIEEIIKGLTSPIIKKLSVKYKMKYTNRKYLVYCNPREERKVLPPNDVLNKDNKQVSLVYNIGKEIYYFSREATICESLNKVIEVVRKYQKLFFSTTEEQRDRILSADPEATFPQDDFVNTKLNFYQLEALLLNKKNRILDVYGGDKTPTKSKVTIEPHELSFLPAHGNSILMIRYKGIYYGYYESSYFSEQKEKSFELSYGSGITREQTVEQIKKKHELCKSAAKNHFPGIKNEEVQDVLMKRLEQLDNTNYTDNFNYYFGDAISFCIEHGLDEAAKFIVLNFPDKEEVKKNLEAGEFFSKITIGKYIIEGNFDMVKFFYEQGADFSGCSCSILKTAAKYNRLDIFKLLFSKYEKKMSLREVGDEIVQDIADEGHIEILDFLASKGYFCNAVKFSKEHNESFYDKKMASAFEKNKKLYNKIITERDRKRMLQEQGRERKRVEDEKVRKEKLISNLESSSENIKSKINNLSSDKLEQLETILNS